VEITARPMPTTHTPTAIAKATILTHIANPPRFSSPDRTLKRLAIECNYLVMQDHLVEIHELTTSKPRLRSVGLRFIAKVPNSSAVTLAKIS
jgi:hypothetical protein